MLLIGLVFTSPILYSVVINLFNPSNPSAEQDILHTLNHILHITQTQGNGALNSVFVLLLDAVRLREDSSITDALTDRANNQRNTINEVMESLLDTVNSAIGSLVENQAGFNGTLNNAVNNWGGTPTIITGPNGLWYGNNPAEIINRLSNQHQHLIDTGRALEEAINQFLNDNGSQSRAQQFGNIITLARRFISVTNCEQSAIIHMLENFGTTQHIYPNTTTSQQPTGIFVSRPDYTGIFSQLEPLEDLLVFDDSLDLE